MDVVKVIDKLANHDSRLCNLEIYQDKQNGTMQRIEKKVDRLIWALGSFMSAIIFLLIGILIKLTVY